MHRKEPATASSAIRKLRLGLKLSQPQFANLLGVATETYRSWDSGRRVVPDLWLDRARQLATAHDPYRLWSMWALSLELGVHVRTLRDAARSGRLEVTYGNRVVFGNPVPKATLPAGRAYFERYYKRSYSRFALKPSPPERANVPLDWDRRLRFIRLELRLTQAQLAQRIGAAGKAVVYQWESRRRKPSSISWRRIDNLLTAPQRRSVAAMAANTVGQQP